MIKAQLFDVVELLYPIPAEDLPAGVHGTLVHQYDNNTFETEFINDLGETIALCPLRREQFIVVWQASTEQTVSVSEQVAQVVAILPQQVGTEVLNYARYLSTKSAIAA